MRTIYYSPEMIDAVKGYRARKNIRLLVGIVVLFTTILGLGHGNPRWLGAIKGAGLGIGLMSISWLLSTLDRRGKLRKGELGVPLSGQMMMDDEKLVTDVEGVKITIPLRGIAKIVEVKDCLILTSEDGNSITLPRDQLLDHEKNLLDEVKSRIEPQTGVL